MPDVHLRMSGAQQVKLDALAERAGTTRSGVVRRLINTAGADVRAPSGRLSEAALLDLLHEQARSGRTAAILACCGSSTSPIPAKGRSAVLAMVGAGES